MTRTAQTLAILFTDIERSTELRTRRGEELAMGVLRANEELTRAEVSRHAGREIQFLGDGFMLAFASARDALACAIAIQRAIERHNREHPQTSFKVRIGIEAGEVAEKEGNLYGVAVNAAARITAKAKGGQVLLSEVAKQLSGTLAGVSLEDRGTTKLKGFDQRFRLYEALWQPDDPLTLLKRTPFVGRDAELTKLRHKLGEMRAGNGAIAMLTGEPGIGKSRTAEEFAQAARWQGSTVLWGRCYEGESAQPYGPFAEALGEYAKSANPDELRADLGHGAAPLSRLTPALRERLPDIPEPAAINPDEERFRLFDSVAQFLIAVSARIPLLIVLDDLHWADKGTIAMLRHVARFAPKHRMLILGLYRDVELDRQHPLAEALAGMRREIGYERVALKGLEPGEVGQLLDTIAEDQAPKALVETISRETDGNPFFIREVLLHLVEEKKIFRDTGKWSSNLTIEEIGIPEGVREVIGRRLSRLSTEANGLLAVASAFNSAFRFDIAAMVAGLDERRALGAIDEALAAQLLQPAGVADSYDFTHALIRHTLYSELNPSRQVRVHRQIAEAMEHVYRDEATQHAAEIAYQYSRSSALPGAERGAIYAIAAADRAEAAYAHDDVVTFSRIALELLHPEDPRRARLLGRLALALVWTLNPDEGLDLAQQAGDRIAQAEGESAAADYLEAASRAMMGAGFMQRACELARQGLPYIKDRRDGKWVWLTNLDILREEFEEPNNPGIPLDTPRRRELASVLEHIPAEERLMAVIGYQSPLGSRADALARAGAHDPMLLMFWVGEYRSSLALWKGIALQGERQGRIGQSLSAWAEIARCHNALGELPQARAAYDRGTALARVMRTSLPALLLAAAGTEMAMVDDEGWVDAEEGDLWEQRTIETGWCLAAIQAVAAYRHARLGRAEEAMIRLPVLVDALDRAPGWAANYLVIAGEAASTLWLLGRSDFAGAIERNVREKVVKPDFRFPMRDGRLSLARLCALQARYEEAEGWFDKSRAVLDEQGARPLRAIADYDQALMHHRRGASGDVERAKPFLDAALKQFREIGMTGWIKRAEKLAAGTNPI